MPLDLAPDTVLQKTAAGVDEIATRKNGLPARMRSLLILVDGRLDIAQLTDKGQALGLALEHVESLVAAGLCEAAAGLAVWAAAAGPAPAAPQRRPVKRSVAVARMYLLEQMDRFLGADSEPVRVAIREARSHVDVVQVLELSLEVVRNAAGETRAGILRERVTELLPD
jgi:hypothetical protein